MKAYQGVVKEFSVDDKGTVMVGALGLPPITGSNPSARACVTALRIMNGIQVSLLWVYRKKMGHHNINRNERDAESP